MGKGRAAVVLQRPEPGIGVDLVRRRSQIAAPAITAEIVTMGSNRPAAAVKKIRAIGAGVQNGIAYLECAVGDVDTSALRSRVAADRAICDATATIDGATRAATAVLADSTIAYR